MTRGAQWARRSSAVSSEAVGAEGTATAESVPCGMTGTRAACSAPLKGSFKCSWECCGPLLRTRSGNPYNGTHKGEFAVLEFAGIALKATAYLLALVVCLRVLRSAALAFPFGRGRSPEGLAWLRRRWRAPTCVCPYRLACHCHWLRA